MSRVAICVTVRDAADLIPSFVEHHLRLGVESIHFFVEDDDPIPEPVRGRPEVRVTRTDAAFRATQRELTLWPALVAEIETAVMARQLLNAETAARRARAEGVEWLLHLDIDEMVAGAPNLAEFFASVEDDIGEVCLVNHEVAPDVATDRPFESLTLFKRNPYTFHEGYVEKHFDFDRRRWFFVGYRSCKSAVRLDVDGIVPMTPHRWQRPDAATRRIHFVDHPPFVLHYINPSFAAFAAKYALLGNFPSTFRGTTLAPDFHLESRDVFAKGEPELAAAFYGRHVEYADPVEVDALLAAGILFRCDEVSRHLTRAGSPA